ncbi:MAG: hypothetical protein E7365_06885 [Clostridiales bacterium]|nr:hypothetical protein [Clostridiales bacterium]
MKKILTFVLVLVLMLGTFTGCTLIEDDDSNVVVATVNGKPILKSEYDELYDYYYYMYTQYYGNDASTAVSYLQSSAQDFLDDLVEQEVLKQKAEAAGYLNYTDEDKAEAQKSVDEEKNTYIDEFVNQCKEALKGQDVKGKNEGESDEDYFKRIGAEKYAQNLNDNGTSEEKMLEDILLNNAIEKYKKEMLKDVTVLEADIVAHYDELYKEQSQELSTDANFVKAMNGESITLSTGSSKSYSNIVYYRKGYSKVQHILVQFDEEDVEELSGYVTTIAEYDEEIADYESELTKETDDTKKADLQKSIDAAKNDKAAIQSKYDTALKAACEKIQGETDKIYASVKDGDEANFIKVMVEKTEDTGMNTEEAAKNGYLVGPEDGMVTEFSSAATALKDGEISKPVATYYGYHIIRCIKVLPEGKVAYDDVKEELKETLTEEKKNTEWNKLVETWTDEAKIKKYSKRIED